MICEGAQTDKIVVQVVPAIGIQTDRVRASAGDATRVYVIADDGELTRSSGLWAA